MRIFTGEWARWLMAAGIAALAMASNAQAQTTPQAAREIKGLLTLSSTANASSYVMAPNTQPLRHGSTWRKS